MSGGSSELPPATKAAVQVREKEASKWSRWLPGGIQWGASWHAQAAVREGLLERTSSRQWWTCSWCTCPSWSIADQRWSHCWKTSFATGRLSQQNPMNGMLTVASMVSSLAGQYATGHGHGGHGVHGVGHGHASGSQDANPQLAIEDLRSKTNVPALPCIENKGEPEKSAHIPDVPKDAVVTEKNNIPLTPAEQAKTMLEAWDLEPPAQKTVWNPVAVGEAMGRLVGSEMPHGIRLTWVFVSPPNTHQLLPSWTDALARTLHTWLVPKMHQKTWWELFRICSETNVKFSPLWWRDVSLFKFQRMTL